MEKRKEMLKEKEDFFNSSNNTANSLRALNHSFSGPTYGSQTDMKDILGDSNSTGGNVSTTKIMNRSSAGSFRLFTSHDNVPSDHRFFRNEPSVANNNSLVFYAGTFYAAISEDSGQRWTYINLDSELPYDCCDQNLIFDPNHRIFIWTMMDIPENHGTNVSNITIGISRNLFDWTMYNMTRSMFNHNWNDQAFDYPQAVISNDYLYITTNRFSNFLTEDQEFEGALIARANLQLLADGAPISFKFVQYLTPVTTITPVHGASNEMYLATHLSYSTNDRMRIFKWRDGSNVVNWADRRIPEWTGLENINSTGMTCPGPDGHDWCGASDTRITNGWVLGSKIGFFWNVPSGNRFPYPYINAATFDKRDLTYLSRPYIWSPNHAWLYAAASPSTDQLGIVAFYGGGSFYPSIAAGLRDDSFDSGRGWNMHSIVRGSNGPQTNEWGDFIQVSPYSGVGPIFVASGFTLRGGDTESHLLNSYFMFGDPKYDLGKISETNFNAANTRTLGQGLSFPHSQSIFLSRSHSQIIKGEQR